MENSKTKIAVLGGGSWATALVKILTDNSLSKSVHWWMRDQAKVDYIQVHSHNEHYLSSVSLDNPDIYPTANIKDTFANVDVVILAIPSAFVHNALKGLTIEDFKGVKVVSAVKGLIPETREILGDYLAREWQVPVQNIAVITGPCHAEEVALEKLSYLTVGSENEGLAREVAAFIEGPFIRTTITDDIFGTEYSAVLKNVYAIASGICHGLHYGDNFQAVLVSNAIREIKRFIAHVHPIARDIDDSAYLGDLLVTAYSSFSRNRTFGNMLGKGYSSKSAQLEMNMIAEGYYAVESIYQMNKHLQIDMPILDFVHAVTHEGKRAKDIAADFTKKLT